ncbi:MAG: hypothetical protein PHT41_05010 [Candidatus Omnitrophica bacterium]|nr:hypothetical protein [Candidatus Omnitrophota bacterium]MDD5237716.1 hypothetical protein [Candidatus Omnitrophota bacterium]
MNRIKGAGIIVLFLFLVGIFLFSMPGTAYCSSEQLIQLIKETYGEWEEKNPELATAFREEVSNLRVLETRENITSDKAAQKLETLESKQAISQQAADTRQGIADDRKSPPCETINTAPSNDEYILGPSDQVEVN